MLGVLLPLSMMALSTAFYEEETEWQNWKRVCEPLCSLMCRCDRHQYELGYADHSDHIITFNSFGAGSNLRLNNLLTKGTPQFYSVIHTVKFDWGEGSLIDAYCHEDDLTKDDELYTAVSNEEDRTLKKLLNDGKYPLCKERTANNIFFPQTANLESVKKLYIHKGYGVKFISPNFLNLFKGLEKLEISDPTTSDLFLTGPGLNNPLPYLPKLNWFVLESLTRKAHFVDLRALRVLVLPPVQTDVRQFNYLRVSTGATTVLIHPPKSRSGVYYLERLHVDQECQNYQGNEFPQRTEIAFEPTMRTEGETIVTTVCVRKKKNNRKLFFPTNVFPLRFFEADKKRHDQAQQYNEYKMGYNARLNVEYKDDSGELVTKRMNQVIVYLASNGPINTVDRSTYIPLEDKPKFLGLEKVGGPFRTPTVSRIVNDASGAQTITITLDYIIVEASDYLERIMREDKTEIPADTKIHYVINTYVLLFSRMASLRLLSLNEKYTITVNYHKVIALDPQDFSSKGFTKIYTISTSTDNTRFIYKVEKSEKYTLKMLYGMLTMIMGIAKPGVKKSEKETEARKFVIEELKKGLEQASERPENIKSTRLLLKGFLNDYELKKTEVTLFASTQGVGYSKRIPRLSSDLFREKTMVYQELAQDLLNKYRFLNTKKGQSTLLKVDKRKSETRKRIAEKEKLHMTEKMGRLLETKEKLKINRTEFQEKVEELTPAFQKAVNDSETMAKVNAAVSILGGISEFTSGITKAVTKFKSFKETISFGKIKKTLKTIGKLATALRTWLGQGSASSELYIGSQAGVNPKLEGMPSKLVNILTNKSIDPSELLAFDTAKTDIETMIDATVTDAVGSTANEYKKYMLKLVLAAKLETETYLQIQRLTAERALKQLEIEAAEKEYAAINEQDLQVQDTGETELFTDNKDLTLVQFRLDIMLHLVEFCDASFYHTLQPCNWYEQVKPDTTLEQLITLMNKIQISYVNSLADLYPPPQAFFNISVGYKFNQSCLYYLKNFKLYYYDPAYRSLRHNFHKNCDPILWQLFIESSMTFSIPISHDQFGAYDRVRVDDIKVFVKGVTTANKKVTIRVENNGISQDKLDGKVYNFVGDPWSRVFRYRLDDEHATCVRDSAVVEVEGDVDDAFSEKFNLPTPFTTWTVSLPKKLNKNLNVLGMKSVDISFSGSLMMS